ncbi:Rtr1/RPAP2 family-domain-containing protein [Coniella lustricola]|uniref:RNA polymerase II subunit B1 CTD phosphatase RPAP2 homolog n=1 Tax=Coniella lustricola TaxID=2025994 RepID=A0A2T3AJP0_9PEZI|nr:Rtr1/RPAP2 family-domain-containing protein [Coniella lustricola]
MMASQAQKPVKGILKKPKSSSEQQEQAGQSKRNPRDVALHHARLIQDRKDIESLIFDYILALIDLPANPSHPASSPHPNDIATFLGMVRIFQPSDYDDLITERNLNENRCGYTLCPNKRRKFRGAGTYKLVNQGRKDFDIVETKELEKWCSKECTRRALWIKVQLNETAAWERVGLPELKVELYPEKTQQGDANKQDAMQIDTPEQSSAGNVGQTEPQRLATEMARLQLEQDRKAAQQAQALAMERGDGGGQDASAPSFNLVIREKRVNTQAVAPSTSDDTIEGYKSRFGTTTEDGA